MPRETVLGMSAVMGDMDECNLFVSFSLYKGSQRLIIRWTNTGGFLSFDRVKRLICEKFDYYSLERYLVTMAR